MRIAVFSAPLPTATVTRGIPFFRTRSPTDWAQNTDAIKLKHCWRCGEINGSSYGAGRGGSVSAPGRKRLLCDRDPASGVAQIHRGFCRPHYRRDSWVPLPVSDTGGQILL